MNLEDLVRSAALIESVPNRKENKKPNVKMYHKFFIPVYTGEKTIVMCLVTEEQKSKRAINQYRRQKSIFTILLYQKERVPPLERGFHPLGKQIGFSLK